MKAIIIDRTGERGRLEDISVPQVGPHDALVRVTYAGVNPIDMKVRDGHAGAIGRSPFVLGQDFAGVVESIGDAVRQVAVGDRVFGVARGSGSYAERALVTEGIPAAPFARIPNGLNDATAAALPTPALTALAALELLHVGNGTRVAIAGAAGAVGSAAVQMAHARGAIITAIVKKDQRDEVLALGADRIVDADGGVAAVKSDEKYDAVLDVINDGETLKQYVGWLRAGGALVTTVHDADVEWFAEHNIVATNITMAQTPQSSPQGLETVGRFAVEGTLRVTYSERPLDDAPQVLDDIAAGRGGGKIVLRVGEPG
jgi:NADPH:quinone reductase-like Zn-dependent oxidoreductase